jgi:hypothetical protein
MEAECMEARSFREGAQSQLLHAHEASCAASNTTQGLIH